MLYNVKKSLKVFACVWCGTCEVLRTLLFCGLDPTLPSGIYAEKACLEVGTPALLFFIHWDPEVENTALLFHPPWTVMLERLLVVVLCQDQPQLKNRSPWEKRGRMTKTILVSVRLQSTAPPAPGDHHTAAETQQGWNVSSQTWGEEGSALGTLLLCGCQQIISMAPGSAVNCDGFAPTSSRCQESNTDWPTASWAKHPAMGHQGFSLMCSPAHPMGWQIQWCMQRAGLMWDYLE